MTRTSLICSFLTSVGLLTSAVAADELSAPTANALAPGVTPILTPAVNMDQQDAEAADLALALDDEMVVRQPQVCEPKLVDNRAKLNPNCINRIVNLGVRKGRYSAQSRDKRELRSLCANTFLPRCRHKY